MKTVLLSMITCAALFTACKKDKEKTTTEKVQATWNVNSYAYNDFYNNTAHPFNITGVAGDYVEFRADGKAYSKFGGNKDTVAYSISGDNKIVFDSETFDIKTLTDNQFVMYSKLVSPTAPSEYEETTLTLSK